MFFSYCERLLDVGGSIRDEAKSLIHEIQQMKLFLASRPGGGGLIQDGPSGFAVPTTPIVSWELP